MHYFLVAKIQQVIGGQAGGSLMLKDDRRNIGRQRNIVGDNRQLFGDFLQETEIDPEWEIELDTGNLLIAKFINGKLNVLGSHLFDIDDNDAKAPIASGFFQPDQYLRRTKL